MVYKTIINITFSRDMAPHKLRFIEISGKIIINIDDTIIAIFITNKDTIQYLTANSNVSIVEMLVENDKVSYLTKKNIKVLNPQSKYKMFVLFFMRFPVENKAVYYLYRYG